MLCWLLLLLAAQTMMGAWLQQRIHGQHDQQGFNTLVKEAAQKYGMTLHPINPNAMRLFNGTLTVGQLPLPR